MNSNWFNTSLCKALLAQERILVNTALENIFGDHLLQIGSWGEPGYFFSSARSRYQNIVDINTESGLAALVSFDRLPIATDSLDAVFLPHTLEFNSDPHAILREVNRALRPDGQLITLGFNPFSVWGLRQYFSSGGFPPNVLRYISRGRLVDWLSLLNLSIDQINLISPVPLFSYNKQWFQRLPGARAAYMIIATKKTIPLTNIRSRTRQKTSLVRGFANPTTRNVE
ncbi:MAG: methyltransferase domain-containing protein [Pseudomonadota bacterium]|nr:methyltransferase domain-containing protein [Pseudomonadota bacterium]